MNKSRLTSSILFIVFLGCCYNNVLAQDNTKTQSQNTEGQTLKLHGVDSMISTIHTQSVIISRLNQSINLKDKYITELNDSLKDLGSELDSVINVKDSLTLQVSKLNLENFKKDSTAQAALSLLDVLNTQVRNSIIDGLEKSITLKAKVYKRSLFKPKKSEQVIVVSNKDELDIPRRLIIQLDLALRKSFMAKRVYPDMELYYYVVYVGGGMNDYKEASKRGAIVGTRNNPIKMRDNPNSFDAQIDLDFKQYKGKFKIHIFNIMGGSYNPIVSYEFSLP